MATQNALTTIQKVNPLNKDEEKKKFFFDPLYNPQFEYEEDISEDEFLKYGPVSDQYLAQAKTILDLVVKKYGGEEEYIKAVEGEVLSKTEVEESINEYLLKNNLDKDISVVYSSEFVARTSMKDNVLKVRLPLEYGRQVINGMLNHEIGTHYFRTLNEQLRPWYKQRKQFGLGSYIETEEGLAITHHFMVLDQPYLWRSALYYYGCWLGSQMSFSELNKALTPYVKTPERRWKTCLRIKRGMEDTSLPGAFSHDQLYLSGCIKVLNWLEAHQYDASWLYLGKIGLQDIERVKAVLADPEIRLPAFLTETSREDYKKAVTLIKKVNKLE